MEIKELSSEKQFAMHSFAAQVRELNESETKKLLLELYEQKIVRENVYQRLMNHDWNGSILE